MSSPLCHSPCATVPLSPPTVRLGADAPLPRAAAKPRATPQDYCCLDQSNPFPGVQMLPAIMACSEEVAYVAHPEYAPASSLAPAQAVPCQTALPFSVCVL